MSPQPDDEPNEFSALTTLDMLAAFLHAKYGERGSKVPEPSPQRGSGFLPSSFRFLPELRQFIRSRASYLPYGELPKLNQRPSLS